MGLIPMEFCGGGTLGTPEEIGTITVNGTTYTKYRVIVDCGVLPNNTTKTVQTGIPSIHRPLSVSGVAFSSSNWVLVLPVVGNDLNVDLTLTNASTIRLRSNFDASVYSAFVTIEYY